jgi:signal peptidase I
MARNHYDGPMTTQTPDFTTLEIVEIAKLERDFSRAFLIIFIFVFPLNFAGFLYLYPYENHLGITFILFAVSCISLISPGVKFAKLVNFLPKYRHAFKIGYFLAAILSPLILLIVVSSALSIINDRVFRKRYMPVGFFGGILDYPDNSQVKTKANGFKKRYALWLLYAIYFCAFAFMVRPTHIGGTSMAPTLQPNEWVVLNLWDKNVKPNDIVELRFPVRNSPLFIKRVVAVGGDKVKMIKGILYVNGVVYQDENIRNFWKDQGCFDDSSNLANVKELTVPTDAYYVVGDNRTETGSQDSRVVGAIPKSDIIGKIVWVSSSKLAKIDYCQQLY